MDARSEPADSLPADTAPELAAIVDEIQAEVEARRAAGEYPAGLERELDALFEDLVPERLNEHDFEAVLDRAERASLIDLHAPIDDERRVYAKVKQGVQKLVLWYMDYVVRQLATFAANTTRAVRLLGNRVEAIDEGQQALARRLPEVAHDLGRLAADVGSDEAWAPVAAAALEGVSGRVLHADAGPGAVVDQLRAAGLDAYGVDPVAEERLPELRRGHALDHLHAVGPGALAGLLLSGVTNHLAAPSKVALTEAAAAALAPSGRLVVVSLTPAAWERLAPPAVADLSPGRPFHPDTWRLLLEQAGFSEIRVEEAGDHYVVRADARS